MDFDVDPAALPYLERMSHADAVEIAREKIAEWSYEDDPHGYCHTRAMLIRLVEAAERQLTS